MHPNVQNKEAILSIVWIVRVIGRAFRLEMKLGRNWANVPNFQPTRTPLPWSINYQAIRHISKVQINASSCCNFEFWELSLCHYSHTWEDALVLPMLRVIEQVEINSTTCLDLCIVGRIMSSRKPTNFPSSFSIKSVPFLKAT